MNKEADERLTTYVYSINSNQNKHRSILVNLSSQKLLRNDQYPKTIMDGHSVLSNYKMAGEFKKNDKNKSLKKDADEENI